MSRVIEKYEETSTEKYIYVLERQCYKLAHSTRLAAGRMEDDDRREGDSLFMDVWHAANKLDEALDALRNVTAILDVRK